MLIQKTLFYKNKLTLVLFVFGSILAVSYFVPFLAPFRESLIMYFRTIWWAILLGLVLGGIIDHFIPEEYISHFLAGPEKQSIVNAVVLGFFMSVCNHGILALAIQFHKKGAATPAVVALLLASPWANLPLTIMLVVFLACFRHFILFLLRS